MRLVQVYYGMYVLWPGYKFIMYILGPGWYDQQDIASVRWQFIYNEIIGTSQ